MQDGELEEGCGLAGRELVFSGGSGQAGGGPTVYGNKRKEWSGGNVKEAFRKANTELISNLLLWAFSREDFYSMA